MAFLPRIKLPSLPDSRRPPGLAYSASEKPPAFTLASLALQHAATALALITYVLAAAQMSGLSIDMTRSMVTATILGMAASTFFQSWGGHLGSGLLIVHIPDPLLVLLSGMIVSQYGLGGLVVASLVNGLVGLGASYIVPYLRALLPPTVAGVVICVAGISLIAPALTQTTGLHAPDGPNGVDALIGCSTLAVIMGLSIWGNKRSKLLALLAGLITGVVLAVILGRFHGLESLAQSPVFALPRLPTPNFQVDPGLLAAIGLLALMAQLDTYASVVLMHKMEDADWKRPNMRMVGGGLRAYALGNLLAAWVGSYPSATSSANIALAFISRATSRWIGLATACLLAICAFLPQVSFALTLIPTPVIGAIGLYAAVYLIVSGIELIASRALDARGIFMIGLAFVTGMGVMLVPDLAQMAPVSLQFLAKNGIIVAGLTAIVLNLLFRLGISQRASLALNTEMPALQQIVDFVESQGAIWNARRDVVRRAASASLEAAEAIQAAGPDRRLIEIRGSFDEFNLDIEILHAGPALVLDAARVRSSEDLLDMDDNAFQQSLDQTLAHVSHVLLRRLADRLSSGTRDKFAYLRLHFNH